MGANPDAGSRPVLAIGEVLIDLIASGPATGLEDVSRFDVRPGGAPANVAVALARLGVPAAFCGVVGDDPFGCRLRTMLEIESVDTGRLRATSDADTSLAFAWKDERGDGHFRLLRLADRLLSPEDVAAAGIAGMGAVVAGSVALSVDPSRRAIDLAARLAVDAGVPFCFDVNARPALWRDRDEAVAACRPIAVKATLLKLSLDDARFLCGVATAGEAIAAARTWSEGIVVLTDGSRGSWYTPAGSNEPRHVAAYRVDAVEPTGAGDAFTAALISRLLLGEWQPPTEEDIRFAGAAGALATTRPGALDGLPTLAEIDVLMRGA